MIAVLDSSLHMEHLRQALWCGGLELARTSEGYIIRVSNEYRVWGQVGKDFVPACIRFQENRNE